MMPLLLRSRARDKLDGFTRLDRFVRRVEKQLQPKADFVAVVEHEKAISRSLGGRSVFDGRSGGTSRQLDMFPVGSSRNPVL